MNEWDNLDDEMREFMNRVDWDGELSLVALEFDEHDGWDQRDHARNLMLNVLLASQAILARTLDWGRDYRLALSRYYEYQIGRIVDQENKRLGNKPQDGDNGEPNPAQET